MILLLLLLVFVFVVVVVVVVVVLFVLGVVNILLLLLSVNVLLLLPGAIRPEQMRRIVPPRLIFSQIGMTDLEARRQKYLMASTSIE